MLGDRGDRRYSRLPDLTTVSAAACEISDSARTRSMALHELDRRIKRRVREAHAAAGSPSYTEIVERINTRHPLLKATKAQVDHWLAQGDGSVVIPARVIPALADAFDVSVNKLLGVKEPSDHEIRDSVRKLEQQHDEVIERLDA